MSQDPGYTAYHPRWLRRRMSIYWWMASWPYRLFILRELSSVFVAWFVVYLLFLIRAVSAGDASYQSFLDWSSRPAILTLNVVSLGLIVFHAVTWFNLAPQAMAVRLGGKPVPGAVIAASNYIAWVLSTAVVAWLLLGR